MANLVTPMTPPPEPLIMADEIIKQSNYITNARYNFSEYEMKVLIRIIRDIQEKLREDKPEFNRTLFGDIEHKVSFFLSEIDADNPKRVRKALYDLRIRSFSVEDERRWFECGFINSAELIKETQKYQVRISPLLMPYMISTAKGYTLYQLEASLKLSNYAKRLYMLFSEFASSGICRITAEKLRDNLCVTDGYKEYKSFKLRILSSGIKEINALNEVGGSDIFVVLSKDKKGKLQNDWERLLEFKVVSKRHKTKAIPEMDLGYNFYLVNILKSVFSENLIVATNIFNYISGHKRATEFSERIKRIEETADEEGRPISKYAGLVMNIAKEDYGYSTTKGKK